MATVDKDFKVKNGIVVTNGGTFGGPVTVASPTAGNHAATKDYADTKGITSSSTEPVSPTEGFQWLDTSTVTPRLKIYNNGAWVVIPNTSDLQNIPDHIHDTAIDGTGQIITIFWDGQWYNDPQLQSLSGGTPASTTWDFVFDGGNPTSQFQ